MNSEKLRSLARAQERRRMDRREGATPNLSRFSSSHALRGNVLDTSRLPCVVSGEVMQVPGDPDGAFYVLDGYSDPAGPDIEL